MTTSEPTAAVFDTEFTAPLIPSNTPWGTTTEADRCTRIPRKCSTLEAIKVLGLRTHYAVESVQHQKEELKRMLGKAKARLLLVAPVELWDEAYTHSPRVMLLGTDCWAVRVQTTASQHPALVKHMAEANNQMQQGCAKINGDFDAFVLAAAGSRVERWLKGTRTFGRLCKAFPEVDDSYTRGNFSCQY